VRENRVNILQVCIKSEKAYYPIANSKKIKKKVQDKKVNKVILLLILQYHSENQIVNMQQQLIKKQMVGFLANQIANQHMKS